MVSKSGCSGKTGKGLGSGWMTSQGLSGGVGVESTRDQVSGGKYCNGGASDSSGKDWSVIAESEVPSTSSGCQASGRDRVVQLGAVIAAD